MKYVTMIGQVVLSCLNRNSHIFILIDRSISGKTQKYVVRISKYGASCWHPNMEFEWRMMGNRQTSGDEGTESAEVATSGMMGKYASHPYSNTCF